MKYTPDDFTNVTTVHHGSVDYFWTQKSLHDIDYQIRVSDSLNKALRHVSERYDVTPSRYTTQFGGVAVEGLDIENVRSAVGYIARKLARFAEVRPL